MANSDDLERLEQMIAVARHCEEVRAQERKAAIAEMMQPRTYTPEEERAALEMVERAKESMRLRRQKRQRKKN
jgi:hypothetical protein